LPDKERFLDILAEKAGCEPSDWRKPGTNVYLYEVESFKEPGA
jgi:AMMECR1 domain-containing protein